MILSKIKEAVKIRMIADVPIGAHLSGGVDSSLIVAIMAQSTTKKIKTYSVGFKEKKYNELLFAKMVADRYQTDHHEIIIEPQAIDILPKMAHHYEEPFADNSALATWYLCQETRKDIKVALNGDGADEAFGGYKRYQAMAIYELLKKIPGIKQVSKPINKLLPRDTSAHTSIPNISIKVNGPIGRPNLNIIASIRSRLTPCSKINPASVR